jgi:hypothetical protein
VIIRESGLAARPLLGYDPQPPFNAGSPREAGRILTEMALGIVAEVKNRTGVIAERERGVVAPKGG